MTALFLPTNTIIASARQEVKRKDKRTTVITPYSCHKPGLPLMP